MDQQYDRAMEQQIVGTQHAASAPHQQHAASERPQRKLIRAQWHNYNAGISIVTVKTHDGEHFFGEISKDAVFHYSGLGMRLRRTIEESPGHYPDAELLSWGVMPNHFHLPVAFYCTDAACIVRNAQEEPAIYNYIENNITKWAANI